MKDGRRKQVGSDPHTSYRPFLSSLPLLYTSLSFPISFRLTGLSALARPAHATHTGPAFRFHFVSFILPLTNHSCPVFALFSLFRHTACTIRTQTDARPAWATQGPSRMHYRPTWAFTDSFQMHCRPLSTTCCYSYEAQAGLALVCVWMVHAVCLNKLKRVKMGQEWLVRGRMNETK